MAKHPIKRLDQFKLGDWVVENYKWLTPDMGQIIELNVGNESGYRYARIRCTDGTAPIVSIDNIRHLEPELVTLINAVNTP